MIDLWVIDLRVMGCAAEGSVGQCGMRVVNRDWCLKLGGSILGGYISCLRT